MHAPYQEDLVMELHECLPYGWRYLAQYETVRSDDLVFREFSSDDQYKPFYEVPVENGMLGMMASDYAGYLGGTQWRAIRRVG